MADAHAIALRAPFPVKRRSRAVPEVRDADTVYRELAPAVLGYLRAQGAADPEDLLMEVFVTVVRDLAKVTGDDDPVRRWVFTIAHHRIVDERRWRARRSRLGSADAERATEQTTRRREGAATPGHRESRRTARHLTPGHVWAAAP